MTSDATERRSPGERALKWIAATTAVISLIFGVQKLMQAVAESADRSRRMEELTQVASRQTQSGDYSLAWESLASAAKLAEAGGTFARMFGSLDANATKVRVAREDVAMAWLDNISVPSGQGFSSIVDKVLPTLDEGVLAAQSARKGDLLAHIGWGYFLRGRDGTKRIDPVPQYEQAVAADPDNPFAHANWGHWVLWNAGTFEQANEHFRRALAANRGRDRVRELQLSAYANRGSPGDIAYVAVVVEMLKNVETLKNKESFDKAQRRALWHIDRACRQTGTRELLTELINAIPKADLAKAYQALIEPPRDDGERARQTKCLAAISS